MSADEPVRLELYVRSLHAAQAHGRQDAVIERLNALEDAGVIDEYQLVVWGRQAPASPAEAHTDAGVFTLNRVAVFSEWAAANEFSVDEHFEQRSVDSSMAGESYQAVRFPVMTLAEYHGQDLAFVAPATRANGTHSVGDRLDTIEATPRAGERAAEFTTLDHAYSEPPHQLTLTDPNDPDLTNP
ncbi:MAG: HTH domain-containing protein [Halorientalis sp.]